MKKKLYTSIFDRLEIYYYNIFFCKINFYFRFLFFNFYFVDIKTQLKTNFISQTFFKELTTKQNISHNRRVYNSTELLVEGFLSNEAHTIQVQ